MHPGCSLGLIVFLVFAFNRSGVFTLAERCFGRATSFGLFIFILLGTSIVHILLNDILALLNDKAHNFFALGRNERLLRKHEIANLF